MFPLIDVACTAPGSDSDIFISWTFIKLINLSLTLFQVDINEAGMSKILDDNGDIGREDFIKFSQDSKLLDFGNLMGEVGVKTLATYPFMP